MAITQGIVVYATLSMILYFLGRDRVMRRIVLPLVASCLVIVGLAGVWTAARPPVQLLLPPPSQREPRARDWQLLHSVVGRPL